MPSLSFSQRLAEQQPFRPSIEEPWAAFTAAPLVRELRPRAAPCCDLEAGLGAVSAGQAARGKTGRAHACGPAWLRAAPRRGLPTMSWASLPVLTAQVLGQLGGPQQQVPRCTSGDSCSPGGGRRRAARCPHERRALWPVVPRAWVAPSQRDGQHVAWKPAWPCSRLCSCSGRLPWSRAGSPGSFRNLQAGPGSQPLPSAPSSHPAPRPRPAAQAAHLNRSFCPGSFRMMFSL